MTPIHSIPTATSRLESLDILRGMTVAFMILVNTIWHFPIVFAPLKHAAWNGWTPTDLVFPGFLFLMGASLVFSIESRLTRGQPKPALARHIVKRFAILFALGLLINAFPQFHLSTLRIYGVLQRIAVCYLVAGALYLWDRRVGTTVTMLIFILAGYWLLLRFVPVPGFGVPGRDIPLLDPKANLVGWLDRLLLPRHLFEPGLGDPEGLLSNLPAIGTTLAGTLTASWLRSKRSARTKCLGMFVAGTAAIAGGELWNFWFPINKRLWTSSYVLFAAGVTLTAWALLYWLVDINLWKKKWPGFWLVFGTNAIVAYVLSELLEAATEQIPGPPRLTIDLAIYSRVFAWMHPAGVASLAYAICFMLVCWLPVMLLYRNRIFVKI